MKAIEETGKFTKQVCLILVVVADMKAIKNLWDLWKTHLTRNDKNNEIRHRAQQTVINAIILKEALLGWHFEGYAVSSEVKAALPKREPPTAFGIPWSNIEPGSSFQVSFECHLS